MLLWTQFVLLHLVTLMLLFVLMTPWVAAIDQWASNSAGGSEEGNNKKVDICHRRGDGSFQLIKVNENAVQVHVNHGDGLPEDILSPYPDLDGAIFGPDCQPKCALECRNGGTCSTLDTDGYKCENCDDNWGGELCQTCVVEGEPIQDLDNAVYGEDCQPTCSIEDKCGPHGTCSDLKPNGFECDCDDNWGDDFCQTCVVEGEPIQDLANAIYGEDCEPTCTPGCEECGEFQDNVGFECPCFKGTATEVTTWCTENNKNCCVGTTACFSFQGMTATICEGACRGLSACNNIGQFKIGANACVGYLTCTGVAPFGKGEIGSEACDGDRACQGIGPSFTEAAVSIAPGACSGESSCFSVAGGGLHAKTTVSIGSGACDGDEACQWVGNLAETVSIAEDACSVPPGCFAYGQFCDGTLTIDGSNVVKCEP